MNNQNTNHLSTGSVKRALHAMMKEDGMAFPQTTEDIDALDAKVDVSGTPTPDVNRFLRFLKGERVARSCPPAKQVAFQDATITQNLAMAARNGKPISAEVKQRMAEGRESAEKLKATQSRNASNRT